MSKLSKSVLIPDLVSKIQNAPQNPGIYIFKDIDRRVLYIGKAINLRRRLAYYTKSEKDLIEKTSRFLKLAEFLEWIEVKNDIEALLLEMNLIRTLKPKYNIISKDDKRPLYLFISNDPIPRVKTARLEIPGTGTYIGPFPSGYKLAYLLKKLRRIFPYCSCSSKRKTPCMYADLGLCPNPFTLNNPESRARYKRNINRLKLFLSGKINQVVRILEKEMKFYSEKLDFEKARELKNQIDAINIFINQPGSMSEYMQDFSVANLLQNKQWEETKLYFGLGKMERIEGFDIANISGQLATASMVVFENGYPNTSKYRRFRIKDIDHADDPLMIYQTISRRLNHTEWTMPDIMLIDGGKTQLRAAMKALKEKEVELLTIGITKRFEQIIVPYMDTFKVLNLSMDSPVLNLMRAIRDEAHRFTTTYHKNIRQKNMFDKTPKS